MRLGSMWAVMLLLLAACGEGGGSGDARIQVVATTSILGDITSNVVGDGAEVAVLMPLGADPHDFQASSQQVALLERADLIVANGLDLEEGLEDVLEAAGDGGVAVFYASDAVEPLDDENHEEDGHEEGDEEEGHDHGGVDPHIWMDPGRMAEVARSLGDELEEVLPGSAERGETYAAELQALVEELEARFSGLEQRRLVTNHDSLGYFADRFDFEVVGTVIPAATTQAQPSSADLAELVETIEREGVRAIFVDNTDPTELAEAVAAEIGFEVAVVELFTGSLAGQGSGAQTYIEMMRTNGDRIVEAIG